MRSITQSIALAVALAAAGAASAQSVSQPDKLPRIFADVVDCRAIADQMERLACFDRTVGALAAAHEKKDVLIADREQVRDTKRGLFGLSLPAVKLFSDDAGVEGGEAVDEIEAVVSDVRRIKGKWAFVLEDGAQWLQIDSNVLTLDPRSGSKIKIRRAAIGSFLANVDGQRAIRVRRVVE